MKGQTWFFGGLALAAALGGAPLLAQPADPVRLSLDIVAADDRLQALRDADAAEGAAIEAAEAALAALCAQTGYDNIATCVDIARNEKWMKTGSSGCKLGAGRAWGCSSGAFALPKRD